MSFCPSCGFNLDNIDFNKKTVQNRSSEVREDILSDYTVEKKVGGVEVAVPEKLDNRTRLLSLARRAPPVLVEKRMDTELDNYEYNGEKLFFGEGLQQAL